MFIPLEKALVKKGYKIINDPSMILSYKKNKKEVNICYYPFRPSHNYKFSFPVAHGYNYATYFNDKNSTYRYANYIISSYL